MLGQGTAIVNLQYFESLKAQAEGIRTCEDLQAFTNEVMASLTAQVSAITDQLAVIKPILDLLTAPGANPQELLSWLIKFIQLFLTPYLKPYATYMAEAAVVVAAVAELQALLNSRASLIPHCSIAMPPLPQVPL